MDAHGEHDDAELNPWGIPVLRYTDDDIVRQKFVETIHRIEPRDRSQGTFRDPDSMDDLRLNESDDESNVEAVRIIRRFERERREDAADDGSDAAVTTLVVTEPVKSNTTDESTANATNRVSAYEALLFEGRELGRDATPEERVDYIESRLKNMRGVPPHLHRYVKPVAIDLPFGSRVKKISGGDDHALILLESDPTVLEEIAPIYTEHEGRVLVMGSDEFSQLGLQTSTSQRIPVALDTIGDVKACDVAAGRHHSVLLTKANECVTWGKDTSGCTGQGESGTNREHGVPRWMYWITNATTKVVSCAAGDAHTFITSVTGHVYSFGSGTHGQLGHADGLDYAKPKLVEAISKLSVSVVVCGGNHTLVLTKEGLVYGFGSNSHGQLGHAVHTDIFHPRRLANEEFVGGLPMTVAVEELYLNAHELESRAVRESNELTMRGDSKAKTSSTIRSKVISAAAGKNHTVLLTEKGRVFVCGSGSHGQLGLRGKDDVSSVTLLSTMITLSVTQVGAGDLHTVMLTTLGDVFVCGANDFGQLGDGSVKGRYRPQKMQPTLSTTDRIAMKTSEVEEILRHPLYGIQAEKVYASKSSTFVVARNTNTLYVCGSGAFGHPKNEHPTNSFELRNEQLTKWNRDQISVMASTFANLKMDEHIFASLAKQMVMYGPYSEPVLAHVFKSSFEEALLQPHLCSVYVNMVKAIGKHSKGCSSLSFRRVVMFAIEDLGVRILESRNESQRRRLLSNLGPVSFQKLQKRDGSIDLHQKFESFITDSEGFQEYQRFKSHCVTLKRLVRELHEAEVLLAADLQDMSAGFPGSTHSISLVDSTDAGHKLAFFQGIASVKREKKVTTLVDPHTGRTEISTRMPDLLLSAKEEAAWSDPTETNTWREYSRNYAEEQRLRALSHGIPATKITNICESMLHASTRNVQVVNISGGAKSSK